MAAHQEPEAARRTRRVKADIKLDATTTVLQFYAGLNLLWYVL